MEGGLLPLYKPVAIPSFRLVTLLRKLTKVQKIGFTGTLDPFASGVMLMLIGKNATKKAVDFQHDRKSYRATLRLGIATDSFDCEGKVIFTNDLEPALSTVTEALTHFQGKIQQIPPMFSAKKVNGVRLYRLARQEKTVERVAVEVEVSVTLVSYAFPSLLLDIECSKGTYIRALADDLGRYLSCGAHLIALERTRCGSYSLNDCATLETLSVQYPWSEKFTPL